jgi:hypothetical protein
MLITIGKLKESDIDYTLLSEEVIGIRPKSLFKAIKIFKIDPGKVKKHLCLETGGYVSGIYVESLNIQNNIYRIVYWVRYIGNITAAANDLEVDRPAVLVSPCKGLFDAEKEKVLLEYMSYLGFDDSQ